MMPVPAEERDSIAFAITVDFVRGEGSPSRPFRTIVDLIEALARFDEDLVRSVDLSIEPLLILEDVEIGSIKSWFVSALRSADDSALRSGDWKRVVGEFAVKSKYALIKRLDGAESVTDPYLLEEIQAELLKEAENTKVRGLPGYAPMSRTSLAAHIADLTSSLEYLEPGDKATYQSRDTEPVPFNRALRCDEAEMTELLSVRKLVNESQLILKVKRPDFLGSSMWDFLYDGHTIEAKILDFKWLDDFRRDGAGLRPGGALRAMVRVEVAYDAENQSLPPKYVVLEVLEVLAPTPQINQSSLRLQ